MGAYGGRKEVMDKLAPVGPVYQAGTLSGNPVAMAAGLATLKALDDAAYERLEAISAKLVGGLEGAAKELEAPVSFHRVGSMFTMFFAPTPPVDFAGAQMADQDAFKVYFHAMLKRGVYLAASAFEAAFVGLAHDDEAIAKTVAAHKEALQEAFRG